MQYGIMLTVRMSVNNAVFGSRYRAAAVWNGRPSAIKVQISVLLELHDNFKVILISFLWQVPYRNLFHTVNIINDYFMITNDCQIVIYEVSSLYSY